jgi:hypothetical protein
MQPCEVCGGMGVDAAGYCTQCRTYRGVPGYDVSAPGSGAPYPGPGYGQAPPPAGGPYQQSGYGGYPTSGAGYTPTSGPGYGPTSGGGYGPTSGGGYGPTSGGGYGQPAPYGTTYGAPQSPSKSRSFVVPLVALSGVLAILVVAIVVVVIVRSGGKKDHTAGPPTGGPAASASSNIDQCVIGTWEVTSYAEDVAVEDVGKVHVTGKGGTVKFRSNGTGVTDYGSGTTFNATLQGHAVVLVATGTITYSYGTSNGSIAYSDVKASGTETVSVDGVQATSQALEGDSDPARYTCTGDSLKEFTTLKQIELHRISATA